jgi:hypothetical protein
MVIVTKINAKIATNVVATIAMPTNNFVQEDLISIVPSPMMIKKLDNIKCLIFYNYNNQQDSFEPCNEHDEDNDSSFDFVET